LENNNEEDQRSDDQDIQLSFYIRIVTLLHTDLLRALEYHNKIYLEYAFLALLVKTIIQINFFSVIQLDYAKIIYKIYDEEIYQLIQPEVEKTCKNLKQLRFNDDASQGIYDNDSITMGTSLFELYLALQRYVM
jgi:hypothetical protein